MIAKNLFRCAGLLALVASAQLSAAQAKQCLTEPEMRGLVGYALPAVADAVVQRCSSILPANSFLNSRGAKLVSDLRLGQSAAWPAARSAIGKIGSGDGKSDETLSELPEGLVGPLMEGMIQERFVDDLKPQGCKDIDRVLTTLAPLPAANMVEMITQIAMIAARDDKKMPTCQAV